MKISEEKSNVFKALSEFKKDFKQPLKDANNPFFKSKYVPLESVVQAIDDIANKYGLGYAQSTVTNEQGHAGVTTLITHSSGEYIEFDPLYLKPDKNTPQGIGSAITYARRYSLSSAFGVASDVDDDGNEASKSSKKQESNTSKKPNQQNEFENNKKEVMQRLKTVAETQSKSTEETLNMLLAQLNKDLNRSDKDIVPENIGRAIGYIKAFEKRGNK